MADTTIISLIAMIGTAIGLIVAAFQKHTQLKYDTKLALLESHQERCDEDKSILERRVIGIEEAGKVKDARISTLEAHIITLSARDTKDRVELEAKINTKKDDTGMHKTPPG